MQVLFLRRGVTAPLLAAALVLSLVSCADEEVADVDDVEDVYDVVEAVSFRAGDGCVGACACPPGCACPHEDADNWAPLTVGTETVGFRWRNAISGTSRQDPSNYAICPNTYAYGLRFDTADESTAIEHLRLSCSAGSNAEDPACVFDGEPTQPLYASMTAAQPWQHVGLWIEGGGRPAAIVDLVLEGLAFRGFRGRGVRIMSSDPVDAATYPLRCPDDPGLPDAPSYRTDIDAFPTIDLFDHSLCTAAYERFTGAGVDPLLDGPAITLRAVNVAFNARGLLINGQNVLLEDMFVEYNEGAGIYLDHGSTAVVLRATVRQNGYPDAACQLGMDGNMACEDVGEMRPGIVVDGARVVIKDGWMHHNGTRGIELYRNVGESRSRNPRPWVAAAYISGNEIHDNGTVNGLNIVKFPVSSTTWNTPIGAGISVGARQGISYHAMEGGPSDRRAWMEPWGVDLDASADFSGNKHRSYNKRDFAVAEIVDNAIYENYVGVQVASSVSAGAMVGFNYRDGNDEAVQWHQHSVTATRLRNNRFCRDNEPGSSDCAGESDWRMEYAVFVGAPSVFENDEKFRFSGWDAIDVPVEVWGNNDFIGNPPRLGRDTHPRSDADDWDVDITGYYGDNGFFGDLDWWQMACDVDHDNGAGNVGICHRKLVRCWEDDDCPSDSNGRSWTCDTSAHDCVRTN